MIYCKVSACRYSWSHTTAAHRCGTCGTEGHGQMECGNESKIQSLQVYYTDTMPANKYCRVRACPHPHRHTTEAHICSVCQELGHDTEQHCTLPAIKCPICRDMSQLDNWKETFVTGQCCICKDDTKLHISDSCRHGICKDCLEGLSTMLLWS